MQLFGGGLAERGTDILADFGLAGADGHAAIFRDVQPGVEIGGDGLGAAAAAGLLCGSGEDNQKSAAEQAQEIAAVDGEAIGRRGRQFIAFRRDRGGFELGG